MNCYKCCRKVDKCPTCSTYVCYSCILKRCSECNTVYHCNFYLCSGTHCRASLCKSCAGDIFRILFGHEYAIFRFCKICIAAVYIFTKGFDCIGIKVFKKRNVCRIVYLTNIKCDVLKRIKFIL